MSAIHHWFRSGSYSLLGHLHMPHEMTGNCGVLIVPPFGWEDVCSYRPLRFMAEQFAELGIPVLRYDLPGTGDSSGDAQDAGLFDAWVKSVGDAADTLRVRANVGEVAIVGIRLGAMLAMTAVARGASAQQLILWGPSAKGRSFLRELRAAVSMERWEYLDGDEAPGPSVPGFGAGGFLLSAETLQALEELDIAALPWYQKGYPALLLSRDELPHDMALVKSLDGAAEVMMAPGRGFAAMTTSPQDAALTEETARTIADFVINHEARPQSPSFATVRPPVIDETRPTELIYQIENSSPGMFGILTEPGKGTPRVNTCLLFLNAGGVRHTGPNRMWVESARRWAAHGVPSLRLDLPGIGESDGPQVLDVRALYRDSLIDNIGAALDSLRQRAGVRRFVVIGLCSGACWGFHAAIRYADVRAAILLNPSLLYWDPGIDRRRILPRFDNGLRGWAEWLRMAASGIRRGGIEHVAHRITETLGRTNSTGYIQLETGSIAQTWQAFERNRKQVTLVFREGEPLLAEMEEGGQLPPAENVWTRCVRVPNGGHTFRPLWAQKMMHDLIDRQITDILQTPPAALTLAVGQAISPAEN